MWCCIESRRPGVCGTAQCMSFWGSSFSTCMGARGSSNLFYCKKVFENESFQICRRHVCTREVCLGVHSVLSLRVAVCGACNRKETVEHAMQCFARLVRLLLGETAIAEKKLEFGLHGLEILGVRISRSGSSIWHCCSVLSARWISPCRRKGISAYPRRPRLKSGR